MQLCIVVLGSQLHNWLLLSCLSALDLSKLILSDSTSNSSTSAIGGHAACRKETENSNNIGKAKVYFCTSVVRVEKCQSKPPPAVQIQADQHQL